MFLILKTEEEHAQWVRDCCPDIPNNICADEAKRLEFLKTGKMILACCGPQETRMMIRALRKMSPEEKREARENIRWSLYPLRAGGSIQ